MLTLTIPSWYPSICQTVELNFWQIPLDATFTYLGLPLGTTKPSVQDFSPLLSRIERRMSGFSRLLSYDVRLILVNVVLSALPTFYMCSLKIPPRWSNKSTCIENTAFGARGMSTEKVLA